MVKFKRSREALRAIVDMVAAKVDDKVGDELYGVATMLGRILGPMPGGYVKRKVGEELVRELTPARDRNRIPD